MNPTDEFILDAFKQQGILSDEALAEITAEVESQGNGLIGGQGGCHHERGARKDWNAGR